jgi:uncharacterized membrane protein (UPF0136 family)
MNFKAIATLLYGLIITIGGIMGYISAKSLPSLISGGILGVTAIIGGVLLFSGKTSGKWIGIVSAILVGAFFGIQLIKALSSDANIGRASGILILSIVVIIILLIAGDK